MRLKMALSWIQPYLKWAPLTRNIKLKKQNVFQKIATFVEKFKGVGGKI